MSGATIAQARSDDLPSQQSIGIADASRVSSATSPDAPGPAALPLPGQENASYPLELAPSDALKPGSELPSHASPEPTQTDLEGHYIGPSSGVSFLLRMQKRLKGSGTFSQGTPVFNFGDAPLSRHSESLSSGLDHASLSFDPSFHMSLSKDYTYRLLDRYFDFAVPVDRFLHRPTVRQWLDEFYDTKGAMSNKSEAPTRTAVLFMMFAVAQEHMEPRLDQAGMDMR